ncbi:hypothetical protein E3U43_004328%2C partial [Scomber scombrus]|uniref:Uncharacterized protein n=1 Tax=Scomber scombrus TaxID=13677 RepID=A0AAV1MX15_SCOSC
MPARRDEGKVRTLGGCCAVEVSSSGFTETQGRQDKVYQVIAQFKLLLGQQGHWDVGCQRICAASQHSSMFSSICLLSIDQPSRASVCLTSATSSSSSDAQRL